MDIDGLILEFDEMEPSGVIRLSADLSIANVVDQPKENQYPFAYLKYGFAPNAVYCVSGWGLLKRSLVEIWVPGCILEHTFR